MVGRDVGTFEDRSELILVRRHFIVSRGHGNAQFIGLFRDVVHIVEDALLDGAEVLVFELLTL